jgi:hypothetical protein
MSLADVSGKYLIIKEALLYSTVGGRLSEIFGKNKDADNLYRVMSRP